MSFYNVMFYMLACFYLYVCISSAMTKIKMINHITRPKTKHWTHNRHHTSPPLSFRFEQKKNRWQLINFNDKRPFKDWHDHVRKHSWWRHQMETFSVLLALCEGDSSVIRELPSQRPVTRSFDVSFDLRLNKRLSKQSRCPDWIRHCVHYEVTVML